MSDVPTKTHLVITHLMGSWEEKNSERYNGEMHAGNIEHKMKPANFLMVRKLGM